MIKGIPGDGLSMRTEYQRIMEALAVALLHFRMLLPGFALRQEHPGQS
jgi:hypothetical protein